MYVYLIVHAIRYVWCAPTQDNQSIIQPARMTPLGGALNRLAVQNRIVTLPLQSTPMHVYAVGQVFPSYLGIQSVYNVWTPISTICGNESLIVDLYVGSGVQLPRFLAWYMITADRSVILCIKDPTKLGVNLDTDTLYFRFYRNAYFQSQAAKASNPAPTIQVSGKVIASAADITALQTQYAAYAVLPGAAYAFVNGRRVQGIDAFTVALNDVVEMVYDGSIYKVVDFPISSLAMFTSTLDQKYKFLLHYLGTQDNAIDYQDDIDCFLFPNADSNGRFSGVFLHRNAPDTLRQVTHRDYAIPTAYIQQFASANGWSDANQLTLRLHIRYGGKLSPLVYENNRIEELYKMEDSDITAAMLGVDSTISNWRAEVLEASAYTQIMRSSFAGITNAMVQDAYGYNAVAKLIADTPNLTYPYATGQAIDVPYVLQSNSTMYEYDSNGVLLGWYNHTTGSQYLTAHATCAYVEVIAGQGGQQLDEQYGITPQTLDTVANYRMYTCPITQGLAQVDNWTDVTGGAVYSLNTSTNVLTWLTDSNSVYTLVRGDTKFLAYDLSLMVQGGLLQFTLQQIAVRDFLSNLYTMEIPMGELDVWLNGHALIEGIDYIYNFPTIYIINKMFLVNQDVQAQNITVRYTGFCQKDLSRKTIRDVGFVIYDQLSHNNKYDIRDDKVLRISVGGATVTRDQLRFSESSAAITVNNALNGQPYEIRPVVVPMRGMVSADTYTYLNASLAIDDAISAYLTKKIPEVVPTTPPVITTPWVVYSPMCCKILNDMVAGTFTLPTAPYSDAGVVAACQNYLYLLAFDPTQSAHAVDNNYMQIDPHNLNTVVTVSVQQYAFLQRVVTYYLNNLVNLSHFLNITS